MILHWLKTGWRSLLANPLFSLITIASLSIGCCGAILAGSNIVQHLSYERWVPHAQSIAKLTLYVKGPLARRAMQGGAERADGVYAANLQAPAMYPALDNGRFAQIEAHTRVYDARVILKDFPEDALPRVLSIEPSFFDVFEFPVLAGDPVASITAPDKIILTESFARQLFGRTDVVGEQMPLPAIHPDTGRAPLPLSVGAVLRDLPTATHFDFQGLVGYNRYRTVGTSTMGLDGPQGADWRVVTVGSHFIRFKPGFDFKTQAPLLEDAFTKIVQTADGMVPNGGATANVDKVKLIPLLDMHLAGPQSTGLRSTGDMLLLVTLGGAALALLGVSTFNYVILSLARSLRRRKEVAVRKILGASKGALVRHYLAEAALVAGISLALGFAAAELLQPWFARAIAQPDALINLYDKWFLGIGGVTLLLLTLAVGFYPAFYLASVRPRAGLETAAGDSLGPVGRTVTNALLVLQVGAASVLLALAFTMAAQAYHVGNRPLGFDVENIYAVNQACYKISYAPNGTVSSRTLPGGIEQANCRARRLAEIRSIPGVDAASSFSGTIADPNVIAMQEFKVNGRDDALARSAMLQVDADFLQLMGAKLLAGRFFDPDSAYDRRMIDRFVGAPDASVTIIPIIVSRAMLPILGADAPRDVIGMSFRPKGAPPGFPSLQIVGVVDDWHQRSLRYKVGPIVFLPGGNSMAPIVSVKPENLEAVKAKLATIEPIHVPGNGIPAPELTPLSEVFEKSHAGERRLLYAVLGFAGVAMLVAGLGIYGLTAFDMRRRVREIGIRKALGASPEKVAGMVLGRQMMFTTVASVASWPIGLWLSSVWLEQYAYRTQLGLLALPMASLVVIVFAGLAVGLNTARAAAIRPSFALRTAT